MKIKECPAQVKAGADDALGQFTAVVSVFGNKDSYGDVVMPGAFTDTLAAWKASGNPIPVIWSHDWADPYSHIGYSTNAEELAPGDPRLTEALKDLGGLLVEGQLDIADNPKALQVYRLLKGGRVTQFSFAYDVLEGAWVESTTDGVTDNRYELRKVQIFEAGPTLVGANQLTDLLAIKASAVANGLKEGRVLASKHLDSLREAHVTIGAVITAAEKASSSDDEKGATPATAEASATQDASRPETETEAAAEQAAAEGEKSGTAQAIARLQLATI